MGGGEVPFMTPQTANAAAQERGLAPSPIKIFRTRSDAATVPVPFPGWTNVTSFTSRSSDSSIKARIGDGKNIRYGPMTIGQYSTPRRCRNGLHDAAGRP